MEKPNSYPSAAISLACTIRCCSHAQHYVVIHGIWHFSLHNSSVLSDTCMHFKTDFLKPSALCNWLASIHIYQILLKMH